MWPTTILEWTLLVAAVLFIFKTLGAEDYHGSLRGLYAQLTDMKRLWLQERDRNRRNEGRWP